MKPQLCSESNKKVTFGIVGGIGPLAGADIFFKLVKSTPAYVDGEHFNIILEQQPFREMSPLDATPYDPSQRKLHIYSIIQKLVEQNATCIILTCFISHTFLEEIQKEIPIPIINMMQGLQTHVRTHYPTARKLGILTSDYSRNQGLFERYFNAEDEVLIYPDADIQRHHLMQAIYGPNGIKAGQLTGHVLDDLAAGIENLIQKGAELIIPGFTEISVVYEALCARFPYAIIDSNQVCAETAIHYYQHFQVRQPHRIGIIGGLGPAATTDFMNKIFKNTPADKDQDHIKILVDHNPQIPDRTGFLIGKGEDPTIALFSAAKRLEKRGTDFIVIPCNTAHAFVEKVQRHLSIPIVNMLEETAAYIQTHYPHVDTVGLLATSGTVQTGIYHQIFEHTAIQLLTPDPMHQDMVMDAIYGPEGVKAGFTGGIARAQLIEAANALAEQGAQVVILGCTELPLLIAETEAFPVKDGTIVVLDPTNILARKCVSLIHMLEGVPL